MSWLTSTKVSFSRCAQILEQVEDFCLNGNVESRGRFVQKQNARLAGSRRGQSPRVAAGHLKADAEIDSGNYGQTDIPKDCAIRSWRWSRPCISSGSSKVRPIVWRG
jgi:hypothetical protein